VTTVDDRPVGERGIVGARTARRRHWRRYLVAAVVVVLGSGIGWLTVQWVTRGPDEASVEEAVQRFRTSSTAPTAPVTMRPRAGVYTYEGSGEERLSFLSTSQDQGPTIPGTVTYGAPGCWTLAVEYNSFHRQSWEWCMRDGVLEEQGGTTQQKFDFGAFTVDETSVIGCAPPFVAVDADAEPGDVVRTRCEGVSERTGSRVVSSGTYEFVGRTTVEVAGEDVPALRYRADRELSGDQTGTERVDIWFAERDGLPLRNVREIRVVSPAPAPLNEVVYTESGEWRLTSLTPQM